MLKENGKIFQEYGPMTSDDRFNPESSRPRQWIRKIKSIIIPNNRKLLSICNQHTHLLTDEEINTLELFRQHVDDFEDKHIGGSDVNGVQFPIAMNDVFNKKD